MKQVEMKAHPNCPDDQQFLEGIHRRGIEKEKILMKFYDRFSYFVQVGMKKFNLEESQALTAYNESLLACIKSIERGAFRGESCIKTYLHTIFRNKCVNEIQASRSNLITDRLEDFVHLPDKAQNLLKQMDLEEKVKHTLQKLEQLGKKCKDILLHTAKGFSSAEIAQLLGYKDSNTVNVLRRRCRSKLINLQTKG